MEINYIGSSWLKLKTLEDNHRNASIKEGYSMTYFRTQLFEKHSKENKGQFRWLVKPFPCTLEEIETLEGELIRKHKPKYNQDYFPEESSRKRGRYNIEESKIVRPRGIYCFEE